MSAYIWNEKAYPAISRSQRKPNTIYYKENYMYIIRSFITIKCFKWNLFEEIRFFFLFNMKESELGVIASSHIISVDKYTGVKSELWES